MTGDGWFHERGERNEFPETRFPWGCLFLVLLALTVALIVAW